jgi:hypothetical protein
MEKLFLSNVVTTSVKLRSILLSEREIIKCLDRRLHLVRGTLIALTQTKAFFIVRFLQKIVMLMQELIHD